MIISIYRYLYLYIYIYTYIYTCIYIYTCYHIPTVPSLSSISPWPPRWRWLPTNSPERFGKWSEVPEFLRAVSALENPWDLAKPGENHAEDNGKMGNIHGADREYVGKWWVTPQKWNYNRKNNDKPLNFRIAHIVFPSNYGDWLIG